MQLRLLALAACLSFAAGTATTAYDYDLLVYGASPAGIAAAVTAANASGLRVALLEPSPYVGGMSGPGGIGLRDTASPAAAVTGGPRSVMARWLRDASAAYGGAAVRQPDAVVAQQLWDALVADPAYNLSVFRNAGLDFEAPGAVAMQGARIAAIRTVDPRDGSGRRTWTARWFVDASYEADIVQGTPGLAWTIGREARAQYGEPLAGVLPAPVFQRFRAAVDPFWPNGSLLDGVEPSANMPPAGGADDRVMPSSYRACITNDARLRAPWPRPAAYDESKFELLIRLTEGLKNASLGELAGIYEYYGYPATPQRPMRYDLCENSELSTDQPSHSYTEYILGNYSTRARIRAAVRDWVAGWAYTLANAPRVPAPTRASAASWGLCRDAWPDNGNWPAQMYVREGVRLVGDRVATQVNTVTGACVPDAVALGAWSIDIHLMRRFNGTRAGGAPSTENEGEVGFAKFPGTGTVYELPLSAILPARAQVTNLAAPVTPSASHVAFGSIRVEPVFMALGTAAGAAARVAQQTGAAALADVDVAALQAALQGVDQCYHWDEAKGACAAACA